MLACDVFYPQFFKVLDDPEFDSNPIIPSEELLRELIDHHATVKGVSSADPSLYCATHIYTASMDQVLQVQKMIWLYHFLSSPKLNHKSISDCSFFTDHTVSSKNKMIINVKNSPTNAAQHDYITIFN